MISLLKLPGLPHEQIQLLNADHRHVCKFADPSDSNYSTLRNAFVSTIESIERECMSMAHDLNMCSLLNHFRVFFGAG